MVERLKNIINCYIDNLLDRPNIQIIEKTFSNNEYFFLIKAQTKFTVSLWIKST